MSILDYIVLVVIIVSVVIGAIKGIIRGLIALGSTIAAFLLAGFFYTYVAGFLDLFTSNGAVANLTGFVLVFLAVILTGTLISYWLRRSLKKAGLSWTDHVLGTAFGLLRGWLICSALYLALTAFPVRLMTVERSLFAPALLEGSHVIAYMTSPELRERFMNGYQTVRNTWNKK